ncbi:MAG: hypothetical protein RL291_2005, partial [Pseudomonadota bacterium]
MSLPAPEARMIYVPVPSMEVGERIGRALVEAELAACVNLIPGMRSIYRWEGKVDTGEEVIAIVKTTAEVAGVAMARIRE